MMINHENIRSTQASPMAGPLFALRGFLRTRFGIIAMAALAIGGGFYFGWGYVVAAGFAPFILGIAPCAAMCALGLCMGGGHNKSQDVANQATSGANPPQIGNNLVNTNGVASQVATSDTQHGKGCC